MIRKIIRAVERLFHWDEFGTFEPTQSPFPCAHCPYIPTPEGKAEP